jgi:hypothetical protein
MNFRFSEFKSPANLLAYFRALLFIIFYFLCLRQLIVFYNIIPHEDHVWFCFLFLIFLLLAIYKKVWALYGIFVSVPLFTGLQILDIVALPIPVYSLLFSSFFLIWLPYRLIIRQGDLSPETEIGNLTDLLAGIVVCSLTVALAPFCHDILKYYIWIFHWNDYNHVLYTLEGAFYLLQGLFFYRVAEKEFSYQTNFQKFISIIIIQSIILLVFSLIQIIFDWPGKEYEFAVFSPFYDIHSYGSYIVLVFFIFFPLSLFKKNLFIILLCLSFLILSVLSFSRTTWAAILVSGIAFLVFSARKKKYLAIPVFIGIIFLVGSVFINYSSIHSSKQGPISSFLSTKELVRKGDFHYFLNRFYQLLTLHQLDERLSLWKRAINIISDFPIT